MLACTGRVLSVLCGAGSWGDKELAQAFRLKSAVIRCGVFVVSLAYRRVDKREQNKLEIAR